jgi:hypothetical protein
MKVYLVKYFDDIEAVFDNEIAASEYLGQNHSGENIMKFRACVEIWDVCSKPEDVKKGDECSD